MTRISRRGGTVATNAVVALAVGAVLALAGTACTPTSQTTEGGSPASAKRSVRVAAASDLNSVLDELAAALLARNDPIELQVTYGSSGNLFAQLANQAPFDLFLSAGRTYTSRLIELGIAPRGAEFDYAIGRLAIWTRNPTRSEQIDRDGITALTDPGFKRIAIANPEHAPYGVAAMSAFDRAGISESLTSRLVLGENVAQAADFARSGAADAGVIALSLAIAPPMRDSGRYRTVAADSHSPIEQVGLVLNRAQDSTAANAVAAYLTSDAGQDLLQRNGFDVPPKDP